MAVGQKYWVPQKKRFGKGKTKAKPAVPRGFLFDPKPNVVIPCHSMSYLRYVRVFWHVFCIAEHIFFGLPVLVGKAPCSFEITI